MRFTFGKTHRLLKTDEFSSVFALRQKQNIGFLCVYSKDNGLNQPRLGLVVSKKVAKRAHDRNYMKRRLREWFRIHQYELASKDYVFLVRNAFDSEAFARLEPKMQVLLRALP